MRKRCPFLWERWCEKAGQLEYSRETVWESLQRTEDATQFFNLMQNRLYQGAFRYGLLHALETRKFDFIGGVYERLKRYEQTGNKEFLVDCANLCIKEFYLPSRVAYFESTDDGTHTTERTVEHVEYRKRSNITT